MSSRTRREKQIEQAESEATAWSARLNGTLMTDLDRAAFRRWLDADPLHEEALEKAQRLWAKLEAPAAALAATGWHRRQHPGSRTPRKVAYGAMALAGCVVLAVCAALWRDVGMIDRAFADYATHPGEVRQVTLGDGTRLYLDGDSAVTADLGETKRSLTMLRGRIWFDVAHDSTRPFSVRSGDLDIRVMGTAFGIEHDSDGVSVTVERGLVSVSGSGRLLQLHAGQKVSSGSIMSGSVETVDTDTAMAWHRGLIVLDRAPLGRVVSELDRMAPGRVLIPDSSVRNLRLSGVFKVDDPEAVLDAMRTALGLKTASVPGFATLVYR